MGAIFFILAILCLLVIGDAVVENTEGGTVTLFGQQIAGFTEGGLLALAAGLGAIIACLLLLSVAASSRRRARRRELRSSQHDLEDRVAELERENAALRTQAPGRHAADRTVADHAHTRDHNLADQPTVAHPPPGARQLPEEEYRTDDRPRRP